jgi:type I restriction enzyme S subunit
MALETQPTDNKHFVIKRSEINTGKIFVEFYLPKYKFLLDTLENGRFPTCQLKTICRRIFDGPFGSNRKIDMYQSIGIPYVRVKQVQHEGIDATDLVYISPEKHQDIIRSRVIPGDVLLTIAGSRLGKAAVFPNIFKEGNITGHIAGIEVAENISPHYLALYINSRFGEAQIARLSHRSTRKELNLKEVGQIIVPVPPRSLQDQIAQVMQEAYSDRQNKLEEAKRLLEGIDGYVFDVLKLFPEGVEEETRFLKSISTIHGGRFDVEFNMGFHKFDPYMDQVLSVSEVAIFPKETQDPTTKPETVFNYIDIASIDIELGEIREVSEVLGADAPSRARQVVHTGDIIISTVRPTRGATALIPEAMDGFICSTGFAIVHPSDQVTSEYLHTALRLHTTLEQFGRRSAGSSYPAILDKDVKATLIPVPSKKIQHEISAEVVRRRSEAKRLRSQAEAIVVVAKARVERMILGEETVE